MIDSLEVPGPLVRISVIIPCYNEEATLEKCIKRVLGIEDENLSLELIIVDDNSTDHSYAIAQELGKSFPQIKIFRHAKNLGKGAALRTGFKEATGDFIAVQDADLEYHPKDLKRMLEPLVSGDADVVFGSRFLSTGAHRVLYFWHSLGNRFLTLLSNMFTDLNLTDMECCYKAFSKDVIKAISISENRFGFEPEIVAKVAQMRVRVYEMGVSYFGRTYSEGKKIGAKDGFRALYCIFKYNAHKAPLPIQLFVYFFIGLAAAALNLSLFYFLVSINVNINLAALVAFFLAALLNYLLCIAILYRHGVRWGTKREPVVYILIVSLIGIVDLGLTKLFLACGLLPVAAKCIATLTIFFVNFLARRYIIFPEPTPGPWHPQNSASQRERSHQVGG